MKKEICFQCEQEDYILENQGVCSHCDYLNRKNDYLQNDVTVIITKDNIHLYYEFMSKSETNKMSNILDGIFKIRLDKIKRILDINIPILDDNFTYEMNKNNQVSMNLFGVKDTLKPIDEYVAEIKASSEYKEYISKNTKIRLDITNIKSGSDFDFCTYIIYDDDIEVKRFDAAFTQKAFINFHNKIFKEFGAYRVDRNILKKMSSYDYTKDPHYISTK